MIQRRRPSCRATVADANRLQRAMSATVVRRWRAICARVFMSQSRSCQNSSTDHWSKHKMGPIRAIPDGRGSTGLQPKVGASCKVLSLCTARLRGGKQRYYYRRTSCLITTHNGSFQLKLFKTLTADKNLAKAYLTWGHRAIRKKTKRKQSYFNTLGQFLHK